MTPGGEARWVQPGDEFVQAGESEDEDAGYLDGDQDEASARRGAALQAEIDQEDGRCPQCGADVEPGMRRCPVCDKLLVSVSPCPVCGARIDELTSNCPDCGMPNPAFRRDHSL